MVIKAYRNNLYLDGRSDFANVLNYNVPEVVKMTENAEFRDNMQMQTQEIRQRNDKAPIHELNKYVTINDKMAILRFCECL